MKTETIHGWIARDGNSDLSSDLYISERKPHRDMVSKVWHVEGYGFVGIIGNNLFPEIQWSDEEPTECEITITIKK